MQNATIKIVNWASFQSYKDRKPPWVRLHKSILDNYQFQKMSADARALLPMLWLIASEDHDPKSGAIRSSIDEIAFRLRLSIETIKKAIDEIERSGFVEQFQSCNESVTESLRDYHATVTPETETEAYKEQRQRQRTETEKQEAGQTPCDVPLKRSRPAQKKEVLTDSAWMDSLRTSAAYAHVNIDAEYSKMVIWCQNKGRQPTRSRFINWLNRIDKPMQSTGTTIIPAGYASRGAAGALERAAILRQQQEACNAV